MSKLVADPVEIAQVPGDGLTHLPRIEQIRPRRLCMIQPETLFLSLQQRSFNGMEIRVHRHGSGY